MFASVCRVECATYYSPTKIEHIRRVSVDINKMINLVGSIYVVVVVVATTITLTTLIISTLFSSLPESFECRPAMLTSTYRGIRVCILIGIYKVVHKVLAIKYLYLSTFMIFIKMCFLRFSSLRCISKSIFAFRRRK